MPKTDDEVWKRVLELMPLHDCGERLQPGGNSATGHLLVCTNCAFISAVDEDWVEAIVAKARA